MELAPSLRQSGGKKSGFSVPKNEKDLGELADVHLFGEAYDMEGANLHLWDLKAIVLKPEVQL